jgi:hypothetical protein
LNFKRPTSNMSAVALLVISVVSAVHGAAVFEDRSHLFPLKPSLRAGPPDWSRTYTVEGMVSIPFAEIQEPFLAYADMANKKSRVDYYGGMDKTFQRADMGQYGTMFKLVPETSETIKNEVNELSSYILKNCPFH